MEHSAVLYKEIRRINTIRHIPSLIFSSILRCLHLSVNVPRTDIITSWVEFSLSLRDP